MKNMNLLWKKGDSLRNIIMTLLCLMTGILLIMYPEGAKGGISDGLSLCSDVLVPSLFPFLLLSAFISEYGLTQGKIPLLDKALDVLLGLDSVSGGVLLMSLTGGFPVGGKMVKDMYEKGTLDRETAKRLLLFCVNPGPAFAVTAVGVSMFSGRKTGIIIYASVALSNIALAFLTRFIFQKPERGVMPETKKAGFSQAFTASGTRASEAMIGICCYVLVFSCLTELLGSFIKNPAVLDFLTAALEVTNGCKRLADENNIPLIAGVIAFGGISVFFQIGDCIEKAGLSVKHYFTARIVSAFLSVIICYVLLHFFPQAAAVAVTEEKGGVSLTGSGISVSIFMLLTCFIFLMSDFTFKSRQNVERQGKI